MTTRRVDMPVCAGFLMPHPPVLIPEIGKGRERDAVLTLESCRKAASRVASLKPDTIVVISPHAPLFSDYLFVYDAPTLAGSFVRFGAHSVERSFSQDTPFVQAFKGLLSDAGIPGGTPDASTMRRYDAGEDLDHGALVPLYFIGAAYTEFELVCISCSAFKIDEVLKIGRLLADAARQTGRRVCIIASGDMSHKVNRESPYGMVPEGAIFDQAVADAIQAGSLSQILSIDPVLRARAAECGYNSIVMLVGALGADADESAVSCVLYSSEAPFGIGYCVAEFIPGGSYAQ